jgi:hypothetical protein
MAQSQVNIGKVGPHEEKQKQKKKELEILKGPC